MSVAALVALIDLGSGQAGDAADDGQTPWALYAVIAISAVIILASIPLLLRARRAAQQEPPRRPPPGAGRPAAGRQMPMAPGHPTAAGGAYPSVEVPTEKLRVFGSATNPAIRARPVVARPPSGFIDRMRLRFTTSMATAIGAATLAVVTATYCMSTRADGMAVVALVIAGLITLAMPLIPLRHLRELRS